MKKIFTFLLTAVLSMVGVSAFAGGGGGTTSTYYFKAMVHSTNEMAGKVYVATSATSKDYVANDTITFQKDGQNSASQDFHFYAKATGVYKFAGWAATDTIAEGEEFVSKNAHYQVSMTSNSTDASNPAVKELYAFFVVPDTLYHSTVAASVTGAAGLVSVATAAGSEEFAASMADTLLNQGEKTHTYYLQAKPVDDAVSRFVGWYSDAECTNRLSQNAAYTYNVTAVSTDSLLPTVFPVYAKFELIPYYYSSVIATAEGEGIVAVLTNSNETPEYQSADTASQLVADKAQHTYYLRAQVANDHTKFSGWYNEADSSLLSTNANYTLKVTTDSINTELPAITKVYALFESSLYYSSKVTAVAVGEGVVAIALQSGDSVEYAAEAEFAHLNVQDATTHTYYLLAQTNDVDFVDFLGWYRDAACDTLLSASANYTYNVTATSLDSAAPTVFNVYAKFEARSPYQFKNAGFEVWNTAENEPAPGWNGPASAVGSYVDMARGLAPAPKKVEGREGGNAVMLHSATALGIKTNGNLTTGVMNMGAMTASDSRNNNHTVLDDPNHHLIIAGQPDSLVYYSKYKKGENKDYMASAKVYIHDAVANYQDPIIASQNSHLMGYCYTPAPESEDWIRNAGAFEYGYEGWDFETVQATTKYVLCDLTTNPTAGGSAGDTLVIDDIAFIYNSELALAKFGEDTILFVDGQCTMRDKEYDEDSLVLVANGRGASIEKEYDDATGLLTITVLGQDIEYNAENLHEYQIQFKSVATAFDQATMEHSTVEAIYDIMGRRLNAMQPGVNIVRMADGTTRKIYR